MQYIGSLTGMYAPDLSLAQRLVELVRTFGSSLQGSAPIHAYHLRQDATSVEDDIRDARI